ncbi:MAG: putative AAA+ superfamily ATPase [Candidatus Promineifilaceae bacterium]|jgi:predicted AAA+ superfamily ATPase
MHRYIVRKIEQELSHSVAHNPVTAILGPRQAGKSTLVRHFLKQIDKAVYLDLELPSDLRKLQEPELFLSQFAGSLICIDEIQLKPDLFPLLRALVDQDRRPGRFIVLGSASRDLIRQSSETLAGRIHYLELTPFRCVELENEADIDYKQLWWRGGFPKAILESDELQSQQWRNDLIQTYLSRDIPSFDFKISAQNMFRFWQMLAHFHGSLLNASKIGQSLDVSHNTVKKYLDILEQTFMARVLRPFEGNLKKRLVKSPKVYVRDSGILHALLEIDSMSELYGNPVFGSSWEGWCIEQIITECKGWHPSFYRTSNGVELDLLMTRGQKTMAFEFKASLSPKLSRGFTQAIEDIAPDKTWVVCPMEDDGYFLRDGVKCCGIKECIKEVAV